MSLVRRFMFDTNFDDPPAAEPAPGPGPMAAPAVEAPPVEEPPPPSFSEQDLLAARDEGFEAGRKAGLHEAEAATARMAATALSAIVAHLQAIDRHRHETAEQSRRDAVQVAMAVVRKVLPELARRSALSEVEALFTECLAFLLEQPRITVRVHDSLAETLRERLEPVAAAGGFEGRLLVVADPAVAAGDCRIEWPDGGAERNQERLWQEIEAVIARGLGGGPRGFSAPEEDDRPPVAG